MSAIRTKGNSKETYTISGILDQKCLEDFLRFIQNDVPDKCARLNILVCSNGGHISIALAIGQLLRALPCEIVTYNIANVDSAAIAVFASGKRRICTPQGTFMFHPAAKEIAGAKSAAELRALADEVDFDEERLVSFLEYCTGTSKSVWKHKMKSCTRLTAETALSDNLVTEVEKPRT